MQLEAEIEALNMHLVMPEYGKNTQVAGWEEYCNLVIKMVGVIWREVIKYKWRKRRLMGRKPHILWWRNICG